MELYIDHMLINAPIEDILKKLREDCGGAYLHDIRRKYNNVAITCPFHSGGKEQHPSCSVFAVENDPKVFYGTVHCFACGVSIPLYALVGHCLGLSDTGGKEWLVENFGTATFEVGIPKLEKIDLNPPTPKYLDEGVLAEYDQYHPYMEYRHISRDVAKRFRVGYDKNYDAITFPVWDENNNLLMITSRSVKGKSFYIPEEVIKPVYLLNFIDDKAPFVIVVEGQIDALVAWSYGYPAIALFGCGTTDYQMNIINRSEIRNFVLMYDNDYHGRRGANRFKKLISKNRLVCDIVMPENKDVGGCSEDEFLDILRKNNIPLLDKKIE